VQDIRTRTAIHITVFHLGVGNDRVAPRLFAMLPTTTRMRICTGCVLSCRLRPITEGTRKYVRQLEHALMISCTNTFFTLRNQRGDRLLNVWRSEAAATDARCRLRATTASARRPALASRTMATRPRAYRELAPHDLETRGFVTKLMEAEVLARALTVGDPPAEASLVDAAVPCGGGGDVHTWRGRRRVLRKDMLWRHCREGLQCCRAP
jgi:hypothetical protein